MPTTVLADIALSLLRIASALLLLQHGTTKILDFPVGPMNEVPLGSIFGIAGFFELFGGALLLLGLLTRPVAFILSGMCAVAYFYAHAPQSLYSVLNGGEAAALYAFVFLYLAAAGGGRISLDRMFGVAR